MNVAIAPDLEDLVRDKIANDGFATAEQVVEFALRRLEETPQHRAARERRLRKALALGDADIAAGRVISFETEEELALFVRDGR